ncbi:MAG: hypothetical protein RLO52_03400 [Sandaracinaceae bacterium]
MSTATDPRLATPLRWIAGALALVFGLATVLEGGHVLFGGADAWRAAGDVVPFVLGFNFAAGFAYVATGAATLARRRWAVWTARALAMSTVAVLVLFTGYVLGGGAFETRTVAAMSVRSVFWVVQALALPALLDPRRMS